MAQTLIKICGLTTPEALDVAVEAGASHVGFVHFPRSPRHLTLAAAADLRQRVPATVKAVLLLVDPDSAMLAGAMTTVQPDVVQFHGRESDQLVGTARARGAEAWKALGIGDAAALERSAQYAGSADRLLYDAPASALPGGNGEAFDWSLLAHYRHAVDWGLAGGLTPTNVAQAIAATGAPLVDTSSGVERAPGVKDMDLIHAFCEAVRQAGTNA